jgi:hypothetical protein
MRIPSKLGRWKTAMVRSSCGANIVSNLLADAHVPATVQKPTFAELLRLFVPKSDALNCFGTALENVPSSALVGPNAVLPAMALITRFTPLSRIADQADARRRGYNEKSLRDKPSRLRRLRRIELGYAPRWIVWVTQEKHIRAALNNGESVGQILDRLGIANCPTLMVQITYNMADVPINKVPTSFDAGICDKFRPSPKGAGCGMTRPLTGRGVGFEEYVHRGCTVIDAGLILHSIT